MSHKNVNCLQTNLDHELPKIDHWLKSNQLSLNMNKTNYLFFNKTKQKIYLQINNQPINHAACVKYLSVYLMKNFAETLNILRKNCLLQWEPCTN